MEHAKLILKAKNDTFEAELQLMNTRETIRLSELTFDDDAMNGSEVQVERIMGAVARVKAGNIVLYENPVLASALKQKAGSQKEATSRSSITDRMILDHVEKIQRPAHAPYNFIPLNKTVVEAKDPIPTFDQYHSDRYTGWIELEIETKTPLYIRDTLNQEEMKKAEKAEKEKKQYANPDFFSPGERLRIPGSSLRGMVRTLVEIVSFGKFGFFNDTNLYFRGLADMSNLQDEYRKSMSSERDDTQKPRYTVLAGEIQKRSLDYVIVSSETNYRQISEDEARKKLKHIGKRYDRFKFYRLEEENCYLVVSGKLGKKPKKDWLIDFPKDNAPEIRIPDEDVKNYNNDTTRGKIVTERMHLLDLAGKRKQVPCFYVKWKDKNGKDRVSFGHTRMFRIAYEKTIGEHIPLPEFVITERTLECLKAKQLSDKALAQLQPLLNRQFTERDFIRELDQLDVTNRERELIMLYAPIIDFTEAIFGNERTFAGRVFFEDAFLDEGQTDVLMGERTPKILSSPKPTTFQHYLVQSSDHNKVLSHYNSNTAIRGNKLYWHKFGEDWEETDLEAIHKHKTQYTTINPVKPNTKFTGRIRFENLSDEELGALLFVLDLPEGCYHKLGMGKPLGLGTVQIIPKLYLSDRKQRYTNLFSEWEENLPKSEKPSGFKEAFETYVLGEIDGAKQDNLWKTDRLQELATILNYQKGLERQTKNVYMMDLKEFRNRPVLPKPSKV